LIYELQVGLRYLRGGRGADHGAGGRRNRFIGFIAGVAMLGIALGVAALIVVLSVVNGFQQEVRERMLGVIPHVELHDAGGGALADARGVAATAARQAGVRATSPFVLAQVLVGRGDTLRAALLRGVEPAAEAGVTALVAAQPVFKALVAGERRIVLGAELARALGVTPGAAVGLVLPTRAGAGDAGATGTPGATLPRTTPFTVAGVFEAGHFEYDSSLAFVHLADAAALLGIEGASGVAVALDDAVRAPLVARALAGTLLREQRNDLVVRDWTQANRTWFEAVALQKRMLGLILVLIIAVAAFNLVSTLVMTVTDKRADIAILRTLGASPRSIMGIFFVQGAAAGALGTLGGVVLGLAVAFNLGSIVPAIERALGTRFLPASVYFIDHMPSRPLASDIVPIALASLLLAFVATLYPSWRASRVEPALELRGE
jgi:lipoprotein-releasing system permease protein